MSLELLVKPNHYLLKVAYVGTDFCGFQLQPSGPTIQGALERACSTFFRHPVRVVGASRTDSGVHAEGQVAVFRSQVAFEPSRWKRSLNALLPPTVKVRTITPVEHDFDPIRGARAKLYRYRIWQGHCDQPMMSPYVWDVYPPIDPRQLLREAQSIVGTHDFASFCNRDSYAVTTTREVFQVFVSEHGPLVDFWIMGAGFLKQMVRIIVGTLVDICAGRLPTGAIPEIIAAKRRSRAGLTAPAHGLALVDIYYDRVPPIESALDGAARGYCLNT